ncbi:MAG: hypothetical protein NVS2B17_25640 [Candidatus Velthaea sp.]
MRITGADAFVGSFTRSIFAIELAVLYGEALSQGSLQAKPKVAESRCGYRDDPSYEGIPA